MSEDRSSNRTLRRFNLNRRNFIKYSGVGASSTLLSGCNSGGDTNGDTKTATKASSKGKFAGKTIKIGVLAPSPEDHIYGRSIVNGAKLAIKEINNNGGILGANVEMIVGNTKFQPAQGRQEHRRLTFEENVDVTVGPMFTSVLMGMMKSIAQQKTLNLSAGAAGASVSKLIKNDYERFKYQFRPSLFNMQMMVDIKVKLLREMGPQLGWDTIAVINEDQVALEQYHKELTEILPKYFDVPIAEKVVGVTNWTPIFDKVEEAGADLLFSTQIVIGRTMHKQWADQQRNFELGGTSIFSMLPFYYEELNGAPRYTWTMNFATPQSTNTEYTQPFMQSMNDKFGEYPIYGGACAYDGVNIFAKAVSETGSLDEEVLIPYLRDDMVFNRSTLMSRVEFQGRDGKFPHDPVYTTMEEMNIPIFTQWQKSDDGSGKGEMEIFYPESQKTGEYKKPHWIS